MDPFTNKSNIKPNIKCGAKSAVTTALNNKNSSHYSIKNWCPAAILVAILSLTPWLVHSAPSTGGKDLKKERWFEVELIIFAHNNEQALDSEKWPEITDLILPEDMVELSQPAADLPEEIAPKNSQQELIFEQVNPDTDLPTEKSTPMPVAFVMLKDEDLQLKQSFKKLTKSSKFEPLLHVAWRQPTFNKKHAQTVLLYEGMTEPDYVESDNALSEDTVPETNSSAGSSNETEEEREENFEVINPRFAGTIRLSVARYLHLAADLVYRTPVTQHIATPMQDLETWNETPHQTLSDPQGPAYQLESWKALRGFRLKESRRMRSKRIHYLDHPFLGIVALITPVELPKIPEDLPATEPSKKPSSGN